MAMTTYEMTADQKQLTAGMASPAVIDVLFSYRDSGRPYAHVLTDAVIYVPGTGVQVIPIAELSKAAHQRDIAAVNTYLPLYRAALDLFRRVQDIDAVNHTPEGIARRTSAGISLTLSKKAEFTTEG